MCTRRVSIDIGGLPAVEAGGSGERLPPARRLTPPLSRRCLAEAPESLADIQLGAILSQIGPSVSGCPKSGRY